MRKYQSCLLDVAGRLTIIKDLGGRKCLGKRTLSKLWNFLKNNLRMPRMATKDITHLSGGQKFNGCWKNRLPRKGAIKAKYVADPSGYLEGWWVWDSSKADWPPSIKEGKHVWGPCSTTNTKKGKRIAIASFKEVKQWKQ